MSTGLDEMVSYQCCICGSGIEPTRSELLTLHLAYPDGEVQGLYAHAFCLRRHLHPSVPTILESETEVSVALLNEGTEVWRPVRAVPFDSETYLLSPDQTVPESEEWQFLPGQIVRCIHRPFSGGQLGLAAVALAEERANPSINTDAAR